jgi:LmbE family N-acetylglucosaminyl deacetylase
VLALLGWAAAGVSHAQGIRTRPVHSQETGAAALANALAFLRHDVPRVLYVAAHPDDEDSRMIAWLSRGGRAEVAYLSVSRGEGGQNVIGDELGAALGVLRAEELLAARRVDGGEQFFTRAYDFGFSRSAEETFRHWPRDSLLADMVRIVRAYRPHILMTRFSGGATDGHGQHQVSAIVTRDVYDAAGDTVRFPVRRFGEPWLPLKLYQDARFSAQEPSIRINVGEYDPLAGVSMAEIAGVSRAQHRSQAFGRNDRLGPVWIAYRRVATRVNEGTPAEQERSVFDGLPSVRAGVAPAVASHARARLPVDYSRPSSALPLIAAYAPRDPVERARYDRAALLAAGVVFQALSARETVALGDTVTVTYTLYNRGSVSVRIDSAPGDFPRSWIPADSFATWATLHRPARVTQPWWLERPRVADLYSVPVSGLSEEEVERRQSPHALVSITGLPLPARTVTPITHRFSTPFAESYVPLSVAPGITVTPARELWFARAGAPLDRPLNVTVRSSVAGEREVVVRLTLPQGVTVEPREHRVTLAGGGARTVTFRLGGALRSGTHEIALEAVSEGQRYAQAAQIVDHEHVNRRALYRDARVRISAVDVVLPPQLTVGYIAGTTDPAPHMLRELGISVTMIPPEELASADLARFTTIVVGPRAYEAHSELLQHNQRLFDYAAGGGRLVVQYGQDLMGSPGVLPFPVRIDRPPVRVTDHTAEVTITDPEAPELNYPNRITQQDFAGWVQERVTFAPREWDSRYRTFLAMNDSGETPVQGAVIVAPIGRGTYVYTTLSLFRQFLAGVPGATRLFINLLTPPQS